MNEPAKSSNRIAVPLIAAYWSTATLISIAAMAVFGPALSVASLAFAPLMPLMPLFMLLAFGLPHTANPLPLGILLSALIYSLVFIKLAELAHRSSIAPAAVGAFGGVINGILSGICFRTVIRSL